MNDIVPVNMGQVAPMFANITPDASDLASGIANGFGHIGYKGKVWSIRYRGAEVQLMRSDGDGPRNSIEIVILKASPAVSKIFYELGYVEGSNNAPDCYSTDGIKPALGATKKQAVTCATCPKNAWGSRITPEGKQSKACSDNRRLAVVPLHDIKNEVYGGPMLLRVPAASLQDLAQFGQKMAQLGYPYYAIGVRVAFDPASAFPKFQFSAIRALTNDEAQLVLEMQKSPEVARILAETEFFQVADAPASQQAALAAAFEQPPSQLAAPQPAASAPAPVIQQVTQSGFGATSTPVKTASPVENDVASSQQPQPAPQADAPAAAAPVPAAGAFDFEAALDAKLGELLPPA